MKSKTRALRTTKGLLLITVALSAAVPQAARAADRIKQNNTDALALATSWDTLPGSGDIAVWNSTVTAANTSALGGALSWQGIKIVDPGGIATIGNTTDTTALTLGASGIDLATATQNLLINSNLIVGGDQTWSVANGRTLQIQTLNTTRTLAGAGNLTLTNSSGTGTAIFDFRPGATSSIGFTDQNGFYGYTGNWTINAGVEVRTLRNGRNAWGSGTITLNGGTLAQQQNFNGTWLNNIILQTGSSSTIDDRNISGNRSLKLQGVISGDGNLAFSETGPAAQTADVCAILTGTNTMSGAITINSFLRVGGNGGSDVTTTAGPVGTLGTSPVVNNGTLTFTRSNAYEVANPISGTGLVRIGSTGVTGSAAQVITLTGTHTYTGGTQVNAGTLIYPVPAAVAGPMTVNGGYVIYADAATAAVPAAASITLNAGGSLVATGAQTSVQGWLSSGKIVATSAGSIAIAADSSEAIDFTGFNTLGLSTNQAAATYSGTITPGTNGYFFGGSTGTNLTVPTSFSGTTPLTKNGTGSLTLTGNQTYTSTTLVTNGAINFNGAVNTIGPITAFNQATVAVGSNASVTSSGVLTLSSNTSSGGMTLNVAATGTLSVPSIADSWGTNQIINGTLNNAGTMSLSNNGTFTISGTGKINTGTLALSNGTKETITVANFNIGSGGITGPNGGTITLTLGATTLGALANWTSTAPIVMNNAATGTTFNTLDAADNTSARTITLSGILSGTGSLNKTGVGTLTLAGANTYTGTTNVNGGTLLVNGSQPTALGPVTVATGATLGGSGTLGGAVTVAGTLAPGGGIAALNTAALTLAAGSTAAFEINSSAVAADVVHITGGVTLGGGTLNLADIAVTPATLAASTKLTLLTYTGSLTGTFAGLPEGGSVSVGANSFIIRYNDANAVTLTTADDGFVNWAASKGLTGAEAGRNADPDGDGIKNVLEFLFGTEPNPANPGANSNSALPKVTPVAGGGLQFSYRRSDLAAALAPVVQYSTTLGTTWTPTTGVTGVTVQTVPDGSGFNKLTVTLPASLANGGKLFARLLVP